MRRLGLYPHDVPYAVNDGHTYSLRHRDTRNLTMFEAANVVSNDAALLAFQQAAFF
jgi:hypothetical protein